MKRFIVLFFLFLFSEFSRAQFALEMTVQRGHTSAVKSLAISPNGKYMLSGSRDKSVILWDIATGAQMRTFQTHLFSVNSIVWNKTGDAFVCGSADNSASVWDVSSGKKIVQTPFLDKYVTTVAFTPDQKHIFVGGYSDSAYIYSIADGKVKYSFPANGDQGGGIGLIAEFSPDGKWLAVGESNKTVKVYNVSNKYSLQFTFSPEKGWCGGCGTFVGISPDSKYLVKLTRNAPIDIFEIHSGKKEKSIDFDADQVQSVTFSRDGKKLLAMAGKFIYVWTNGQWDKIDSISLDPKFGEASEATFDLNGDNIFAATDKFSVLVYSLADKKINRMYNGTFYSGQSEAISYDENSYWESHIAKYLKFKNQLILHPNDTSFITNKSGKNAVVWKSNSGQIKSIFQTQHKEITSADLRSDGKEVIAGDAEGYVYFYDYKTGKLLRSFRAHREPIFDIHYHPDGNTFGCASWDASMSFWDYKSLKRISSLDANEQSVYSFSYSPDGLYLILGKVDKSIVLIEPDSKAEVRSFIGHTATVSSVSFGIEKYKMLSTSWDGTARLWDISTGMLIQKFKPDAGPIYTGIFDTEGKRAITAGADRMIRIWDIKSGKLLKVLSGHTAEITSVKLSSDGSLLFSYSIDGTVKCWSMTTFSEFYEHIHLSDTDWMARTKEGYFSATTKARELIHFIKGMEVFHPDQFFEKFYRPDLIPELFKSRGSKSRLADLGQVIQNAPPPSVLMNSTLHANGKEAELYIKLQDNGGGVADLKIYHNGKALLYSPDKMQLPKGKDSVAYLKVNVPMVGGRNIFSATAINHDRIESSPVQSELFAEHVEHNITCHVFAIGIDKYKNPNLSLSYARDDAEAFVEMMKTHGGNLYKNIKIHTLYDEQAVRQKVLDTLDRIIQEALTFDVFVFFYAGHGSMIDGKFNFILSDCVRLYDALETSKTALSDEMLQDKLKQIKALKQVILLDACQSGGSVDLLASRGAIEEKALAQLSRSAGIHILASAGQEQLAKEITDLKHGLFTYVLLDALNGKADGSPEDGRITIYELKSYIDSNMPELNMKYSNKLQFPYTFSKGQDFPIILK